MLCLWVLLISPTAKKKDKSIKHCRSIQSLESAEGMGSWAGVLHAFTPFSLAGNFLDFIQIVCV